MWPLRSLYNDRITEKILCISQDSNLGLPRIDWLLQLFIVQFS